MEARIITIFCIVDDVLNSIGFRDDFQVQVTSSEIITMAISAGLFFGGNHTIAQMYFADRRLVKKRLSKGQFNKRIHAIDWEIWENIFYILSSVFKSRNKSKIYAVDSFPVEVCHNIRIKRCKIYKEEIYRGRCASKRVYFFGLRVHMLVTETGEPVEFILAPGSKNDCTVFKNFQLDLEEDSIIVGDAAYTDYNYEETIYEALDVKMYPARRSNALQQHPIDIDTLIGKYRKIVETSFSGITRLFPKKIHAVTARGFELKLICFIFAYTFSFL